MERNQFDAGLPRGPRGRDDKATYADPMSMNDEPEHESWYSSSRSGGREHTIRQTKARKTGLVSTIFRALFGGDKDMGTTGKGGMDCLGQICRKCGREVGIRSKRFLYKATLLTADTR